MPKRYYPIVNPAFGDHFQSPQREIKGINYKRLPKGLDSFRRMYPLSLKRKLANNLTPQEARTVTSTVLSMIPKDSLSRQGEGTHFLFPLSSATGMAEFVKGILRIKAPKTRVSLLVVPYSGNFADGARPVKEMANLHAHLARALRPRDKHVVVLDDIWTRKTTNAISDALQHLKTTNPSLQFSTSVHNSKFSIFPYMNTVMEEEGRTPSVARPRLEKEYHGTFAAPMGDFNQKRLRQDFSFWSKVVSVITPADIKLLEEKIDYKDSHKSGGFFDRWHNLQKRLEEQAQKVIAQNPNLRDHDTSISVYRGVSSPLFWFMKKYLRFNGVKKEPSIRPEQGWRNFDDQRATLIYAAKHFPTEKETRQIMTRLTKRRPIPIGANPGLVQGLTTRQQEMVADRKTTAFYRRYFYNLGIASALESARLEKNSP